MSNFEGGLRDVIVVPRRGSYLVEEELIRLGELCAEAFVEPLHKSRQRDRLFPYHTGSDISRAFEGIRIARRQLDRTFGHLLESGIAEGDLIVQGRRASVTRRPQFGHEVLREGSNAMADSLQAGALDPRISG